MTIGYIGGTAIRLHITFLLFLLWIGLSGYHSDGLASARTSVLFMLLVFACVVAHEFGHILMARRFGIKTPDVTLLPIGGVANMERIPEEPWQELPVALAGPAVNLVIATLLALFGQLSPADFSSLDLAKAGVFHQLALVNISLLIFNLVPAFPMDGGRVLRAILAMNLGSKRANPIAMHIGQAFAFLFVALGFVFNPMLVLIGIFIFVSGTAELQAGQSRLALDGLRVSDCMENQVRSLQATQTLSDVADLLLHSSQHSYPVLDESGRPIGIIDRTSLPEILKSADATTPVSAIMRPPRILPAATPLESAVKDMDKLRAESEIVVDGQGRLVGMLTLHSIAEMVLIRTLKPQWPVRGRNA
ncbi:MAG: site-2 protease family protein [Alphaproteobacteria bacterium]|nr:site-2 protease family protein [Alphaproteobacteria bacterium]